MSINLQKSGKSEYLATVLNPDTLEVKTELTQSACLQVIDAIQTKLRNKHMMMTQH